ncbi:transcriptional regulator [Mycobacterium sp. ACS1612]|nr:transcriptional regulator [Mycobacterium sp. ACS1612]
MPAARGRGRPVGADSAETRARILRAARDVINERGFEGANFQAIASRAGISRPTMHYYFHAREEIFECLIAESYSIVADCIAQAKGEDTLLNQLSKFVIAMHRSGLTDRSMLQFAITARLESRRRFSLREQPSPVVSAVHGFYTAIVEQAVARGEIAADTDVGAVVNLLLALFLGMGFYAGFIADENDMLTVAKQLHRLITRGLLDHHRNGRPLIIAPPVSAGTGVDALRHTWPELTG